MPTEYLVARVSSIVGARKKGQIAETVKAADFKLSQDDINDIETLLAQRENELH